MSKPSLEERLQGIANDVFTYDGAARSSCQLRTRIRALAGEVGALVALLRVARCPNDGCKDGAVPVQVSEGHWEAEQCQWCDERAALKENTDEGEGVSPGGGGR